MIKRLLFVLLCFFGFFNIGYSAEGVVNPSFGNTLYYNQYSTTKGHYYRASGTHNLLVITDELGVVEYSVPNNAGYPVSSFSHIFLEDYYGNVYVFSYVFQRISGAHVRAGHLTVVKSDGTILPTLYITGTCSGTSCINTVDPLRFGFENDKLIYYIFGGLVGEYDILTNTVQAYVGSLPLSEYITPFSYNGTLTTQLTTQGQITTRYKAIGPSYIMYDNGPSIDTWQIVGNASVSNTQQYSDENLDFFNFMFHGTGNESLSLAITNTGTLLPEYLTYLTIDGVQTTPPEFHNIKVLNDIWLLPDGLFDFSFYYTALVGYIFDSGTQTFAFSYVRDNVLYYNDLSLGILDIVVGITGEVGGGGGWTGTTTGNGIVDGSIWNFDINNDGTVGLLDGEFFIAIGNIFSAFFNAIIDFFVGLKEFFATLMELGTMESKTLGTFIINQFTIPNTHAVGISTTLGSAELQGDNFVTNMYNFIKYFIIFILFIMVILLIILIKRGGGNSGGYSSDNKNISSNNK